MLQFLKTWRKLVVACALVAFALLSWNSNSKEEKERNFLDRTVVTVTAPLQTAVSWLLSGIESVWYGYFYFVHLRESYDALARENEELRGTLAFTWETQVENERLRKMLQFERETPGEIVSARVIGSDSASFSKSVRINRGKRHGVRRNMAVVTPGGVLGRVAEVSTFHSDVQLIADGRSAVPVRVQRTRAQGVLEGLGRGLCHLKYVARSEDVMPGDVVVTSGLGGIFPPGLPVGTVTQVERKEYGVLQNVRVAPAVDLRRLPEEVMVLLDAPTSSQADEPVADSRGEAPQPIAKRPSEGAGPNP